MRLGEIYFDANLLNAFNGSINMISCNRLKVIITGLISLELTGLILHFACQQSCLGSTDFSSKENNLTIKELQMQVHTV